MLVDLLVASNRVKTDLPASAEIVLNGLLVLVTVLPWLTGMSGVIYLLAALALGGVFLAYAWKLLRTNRPELPLRTFGYSVTYLIGLFSALLVDHYAVQWL